MKSIVKTKKGNFPIKFEFVEDKVGNLSISGLLEMNKKVFKIEKINENFTDRINITPEIAAEFGVAFSYNIKLQCNISEAVEERKRLIRVKKSNKYDGKMIDSGYGFQMKNTEKNYLICLKYGFDAIEKIKN